MTDQETIYLINRLKITQELGGGKLEYIEAFEKTLDAFIKFEKIKEITARALRSEDPINLYKAKSLEEIARILEIDTTPKETAPDENNQVTFDDII